VFDGRLPSWYAPGMLARRVLVALSITALTACEGSAETDDKGAATAPVFGDGKADVGGSVQDSGVLGWGAEGAVSSSFTQDLQFQGWHLAARPGAKATLEVTQLGSSKGVDTTMYVYGPKTAQGGYGTTAIAFDDDNGWGDLSKVKNLELAGGEYLVVVGTHDARGRGKYRLMATCESGDCAPVVETAEGCHPAIAQAIIACVADQEASPEYDPSMVSKLDLIELCADAEPVAPAWDQLCSQSTAPAEVCGVSYEQFATEQLPVCKRGLVNQQLDTMCVFGERYGDLRRKPGAVVVLSSRTLHVADSLTTLEKQQIVAAVHATAYTDVTTVEEAFAAVDENVVNQMELWDASNRRAFTSYEVGAGDNSFGMIFEQGTTTPAVRINDGDLMECNVFWGPEMRRCQQDAHCTGSAKCAGIPADGGFGRCIDVTRDTHAAIDSDCSATQPCPSGSGLVCSGAVVADQGICRPGWMRGAFFSEVAVEIPDAPDAGTEAQLAVFGLATVSTDVAIEMLISHERPADLRVSLLNPAGTEVVLFDHPQGLGELYASSMPVKGFPGDESANGTWRLKVVDTVKGSTGSIGWFGLTVTSRWD